MSANIDEIEPEAEDWIFVQLRLDNMAYRIMHPDYPFVSTKENHYENPNP